MFTYLKITIILICITLCTNLLFAAAQKTVYSIVNGASWTNSSHWSTTSGGSSCSCTPDANKDIIYIEMNTTSSADLKFGASAQLYVRYNSTLTVNGEVEFSNGTSVSVTSGSYIIVNGNVKNKSNSTGIEIDGTLTINGEFNGENGSSITGDGLLTSTSEAKTNGTASIFGSTDDCNSGPCTYHTSTLPVELLSFSAEYIDKNAVLKWSTATEINNDHFIIEKSQNSIDFEILAQIKGAGNANKICNYSAKDNSIPKGTFYYRLKQIDFDGTTKYLDIKAVSNIGAESSCNLFVKPNPCIGRCEISFENCSEEESQDARFMLFDALGNAVYSSISKQIANGNASFELDNNNLKPAVYIIRGTANNKNKIKQIIIAK